MKSRFIQLLALLVCLSLCAASQTNTSASSAPVSVDLIWGFKIPLRDHVRLNGTVYKPAGQKEPLPVIFTMTPYIADGSHPRAYYFAQHGYVFVTVDVRGRGNSEGTFDPFAQEAQDGHDIVEFLAKQPWCNGKVAMWGGSYVGYDQWATVKELPPHLATVVPVASVRPGIDFPFHRGIWYSYDMEWLTFTSGVTPNNSLFGESKLWMQKFLEMYQDHRPFNTLDQIVGNGSTVFQKWMKHPNFDSFWQDMAPSREQYAKINVPILTITGHNDGDQTGALSYYREIMKYGNAEAKAKHYLIIGPWDHPGTRTPRKEIGGLVFGDASLLDMNDLHRQWYDWTMKSGPKPDFLKKRVAYYVMGPGAENWKYADDLESVATEHRKLYLTSHDGIANDVFHSGALAAQAVRTAPDKFVYDPLDVRPAELDKEEYSKPFLDERYVLNLFGKGVVYHSDPFTEATEISGDIKFSAWIAMDVPDTDFSATLYEVLPDGSSVELTSDLLRARYRESLNKAKPVTPGEITRYDFDGFRWFSRRISKGSRLRLVLDCVNTMYYEKNYNSGGAVESESGKDARTAHVALYHDPEHPSVLEIPVVK
ncbi:MAG: CocE/NonD family hydrolase [Acidobacteriia bacterium]|nr:CocE/NonD family hydrolase [Terriglobia bacterium]